MSGSSNWVVQNLENALETWNNKLGEIWTLITQSPETFKGGTIWDVILKINGAVQIIGMLAFVIEWLIFNYKKNLSEETKGFIVSNMISLALGIVCVTISNFMIAHDGWQEIQMIINQIQQKI